MSSWYLIALSVILPRSGIKNPVYFKCVLHGIPTKFKNHARLCSVATYSGDPVNLNLSLDLNGKRRQTGNTSLMIFNFNFLISHISQFITLMPGDIITTGTPAGVGMGMTPPDYLKDGDEMILKVDNLGVQRLKVVKEK